jgi:hypothetical protein
MENRDHQPVTKKDLDEAIESFALIVRGGFIGQAQVFDAKLEALKQELNGKIYNLDGKIDMVKRELLESNAEIAGEIQTMRAEQAAILGGRKRVNDTLLDHEGRIRALEQTT